MKLLYSLSAAFTMYSRFPVPRAAWTRDSMAWALCCFPAVGVVIGLFWPFGFGWRSFWVLERH